MANRLVKISRWESSTKKYSCCGNIKVIKLSQWVYECECGLVINRDLNAAMNIKMAGLVLSGAVYQRIIMSQFFQQIEAALLPAAIPYTPEGTDPKAVVHQWIYG